MGSPSRDEHWQGRIRSKPRISIYKISQNPETIHLEHLNEEMLEDQGLCKFEFEKTIAGREKFRKCLNLRFDKQTPKRVGQT